MNRYFVSIPIKNVMGYVTRAHYEGYVDAKDENDLKLKLQLNPISMYLDFYVDDYVIDHLGELVESELEIEEMD